MSFLRLASVQTGQGKLRKNVRSGYAIWKDSFVEKMETAKAYRDRWKTVEDKWFYYDLSDLERQTLALAETSDLQCCVCLESIRKGSRDHVETDPCGHHFHTKCLKTWTDTQSRNGDRHSCPMCRTEFTEQPVQSIGRGDLYRLLLEGSFRRIDPREIDYILARISAD